MESVKAECYGKNYEILERIFPTRFSEEKKDSLNIEKEMIYQEQVKPHLRLLPGLYDFLLAARKAGISIAIGSAAFQLNIDFVLDNLGIRQYFDAVVSANDVQFSKPHPSTYLECAKKLGLPAQDCLVFEDAPKGVEAALNARMDCYVITLQHQIEEFDNYSNVIGHGRDYLHILDFM